MLGIEMSLGYYQVKPFLLLLGILLFITLSIPLLLVYCYIYIKNTLYNTYNEIKKNDKYNNFNSLKGV